MKRRIDLRNCTRLKYGRAGIERRKTFITITADRLKTALSDRKRPTDPCDGNSGGTVRKYHTPAWLPR